MKKYLSIGEVSKIKDVSHTSLRYYDEIGILIPAYINEETGYRYYTKNQMIFIDIIQLAIELGMPLKELKKYFKEDGIDIENFTLEAKLGIKKTMQNLKKALYFLDRTSEYIKENEKYSFETKEYLREFKTRYFICLPLSYSLLAGNYNLSHYWKQLTQLYAIVKENNLFYAIDQGFYLYKDNNEIKTMVYIEVGKININKIKNAELIVVENGKFLCTYYPDFTLEEAHKEINKNNIIENDQILIISDVLEKVINKDRMPFELQTKCTNKNA